MLPRCPFLTNVLNGSKYRPTLMESVGLRVPNRNFRHFSLFNVDFKRLNCPSARSTSASTDIFSRLSVLVNMIGCCVIFLLHDLDTV